MIETIKKKIFASEPFRLLEGQALPTDPEAPLYIRGVSGSLMAFVASFLFDARKKQVTVLVADGDQAEQLRDDCALLAGDQCVRLYAHGDGHKATQLDMTTSIAQVETLKALAGGERVIVIASAEALVGHISPPDSFRKRSLELETGKDFSFEQLLSKLADLGFERKDFVEEYGDFAVRGGILDIFPYVGDNPIRFEFWGDSIESIREFDVLSQRSIRTLQSASIVASLPHTATDAPQPDASLFDYLQKDAVVIVDEPALIQKEIDELFHEGVQGIFDWSSIIQRIDSYARVIHSTIADRPASPTLDFSSSPQPPMRGSIKILVQHFERLGGENVEVYLACDTNDEAARVRELIEEEVASPEDLSIHSLESLDEGADERGESPPSETPSPFTLTDTGHSLSTPRYSILTETFHRGFVYPPASLALFTEHEVFGRLRRRGLGRRRRFKGFSLKEARQLRRGDFVVHIDYGVGKFAGLQKIKVRGVEQEAMKVLYAESDVLYVNLNFVNRVQKYASQEGHVPALTKLGAPDWERLKSRARKRIKDIARELITLYARRKTEEGFAFAPDTHWQKEMEASFMYEDTPDQAKTTVDVKKDMENPSPMDRLVCGDVGFGKTEVAVRAAFKAVMSGKQVGVLVPTTILAQQHFNTFLDRLGRYSVRVESLSRFKTRKDQTGTLAALKEGRTDIIIGTHRLLSNDVGFKNLGLLVIDEEHRFGVSAKEKLRRLRASVDTLTLTATPIPRTLQFSLMGARDLSIINTAPRNRLPIITEIAQYDLQLIREAILKELHRGGQVYFIHDRIHDIEDVLSLLEQRIPEARFHIAHGQMKGHELEKTMMNFLEKKFDVLLCTKIIESGIDIPSVNTIIINRADRFGLAELYQLRGRVGRSNTQAYAYLMTPPLSSTPRQTLRRLQAIQEFTELGSGFNLAMRDLEIRGAGNLLGAEQSGFIMEMGFEMYQRVVEEAVAELKGQEFEQLFEGQQKTEGGVEKTDTIVEADVDAFIPDFYIESDAERLDFYRRLYKVESLDEVQSMREELKDRFGEYPEEVESLFAIVDLKTIASRMGFRKVELQKQQLTLLFPPPESKEFYEAAEGSFAPFQAIMNNVSALSRRQAHLKQEGTQLKLLARIEKGSNPLERLQATKAFLEKLP